MLTAGGSGLAGVDVADDHDIDVKLLLTASDRQLLPASVVWVMRRPRSRLERTPCWRLCCWLTGSAWKYLSVEF